MSSGLALVHAGQRFALSAALLAELRATRPFCDYEDRVSWEHDAFLLVPPALSSDLACYLSAEGELLWLTREQLVPTRALIYASLAAGARATGVSGLRALLPGRPAHAPDCGHCDGSGFRDPPARPDETTLACVCKRCAGLGFTAPELLEAGEPS
ncbi:MAG TPA: hypothetical protein VFZ61_21940 [Polyangiales bacterium]